MFVSVELGATEKSPGRSPTKVYAPLEVIPPSQSVIPNPAANPDHISVITIGSSTVVTDNEAIGLIDPPGAITTETAENISPTDGIIHDSAPISPDLRELVTDPGELETSKEKDTPHLASIHENLVAPLLSGINTMNMDTSPEMVIEANAGTGMPFTNHQASTSRFTQFLLPSPTTPVGRPDPDPEEHSVPPKEDDNIVGEVLSDGETGEIQGPNIQSVSITRNELIAIANVLEKIPQSYITGTETEVNPDISLTVIEDPPGPPTPIVPEGDNDPTTSGQNISHSEQEFNDAPVICNKRPRPRYSLKGSMLRKHPVLKFSATRPVNRDKTPYKWSCRVCRIELSLMSREVLELMAHYKTDSHLIKSIESGWRLQAWRYMIKMSVNSKDLLLQEQRELPRRHTLLLLN